MSIPSDSADLALMRASMLLESDPAAAARQASDILATLPGHAEANLLFATACRRLGDAKTAVSVLESLTGTHPDSAVLQLELGRAYVSLGQGALALAAFQYAIDLDASLADGWRELAAQWFLSGEIQRGDAAYLRYSHLAQEPPQLTDAYVARAADRLDAAEALVRRHLLLEPRDPAGLRMLADLLAQRGDNAEAERCLTECLQAVPGDSAARNDLARLLIRQERIAEALPLIERLLASEPNHTGYLSLKAQSLRLVGRTEEAIELLRGVVAKSPNDAQAWVILGNALREVGEQAGAIEAFRCALFARPEFGEAYWALANLKTFRLAAADVVAMQEQLGRSPKSGSNRIHLEYALGKALEDEQRFAASFEHYARGAALQRATMVYDADATSEYVRRSKALYTAGLFADRAAGGSERRDAIFIIGLPRSGSTLLEQILASHSQIEGSRELPDIPDIVMDLFAHAGTGAVEYPESIGSLEQQECMALAARYLARTQIRRPRGLPRFVDKMLGNFSHLGLIQLMFPHAAIIDARRHPLACSFSCYKQLFSQRMNFSYDLNEMGRYYSDYAELMQHIDSVLPDRVHRVYYEQMVANPEHEVRRLLEYCGLPFEEQCLRFYENRRPVQTISSEQVRRPIYSDAVDHWRHYEQWLGPLQVSLGDWVARYPQ